MINPYSAENVWVESVCDNVYTKDFSGRKYLDLLSGTGAYFLWDFSDDNPARIMGGSLDRLLSAVNFYNHPSRTKLKHLISELTDFPLVHFFCSGSEANDAAIKLSMKYHHRRGVDRHKTLYVNGGYHGRTFAAVYCSQESYRSFMPPNDNFQGFNINDVEGFDKVLDNSVGTIILEYLPTKSVTRWKDEVISHVLTTCRERDINIVVDEVKSGFGRTGRIMASQYWKERFGVYPDIITFGKALSAGVPLSGLLADWKFRDDTDSNWHTSTTSASPAVCDLSCYLIRPLFKPETLKNLAEESSLMDEKLLGVHPNSFRLGKWWTLLFPNNDARVVASKLREKGVLVYNTSPHYISLLPSLFFNDRHFDEFVKVYSSVKGDN